MKIVIEAGYFYTCCIVVKGHIFYGINLELYIQKNVGAFFIQVSVKDTLKNLFLFFLRIK